MDYNNSSLLDPDIQECPFGFYQHLHQQSPVWYDHKAGFYVISKYQDVRKVLADADTFSSDSTIELARDSVNSERAQRSRQIFEQEGWLPNPSLALQDDPRHKQVRAIFQKALKTSRINAMDDFLQQTADQLVADVLKRGECDIVADLAVPLPLIAICSQVGAPVGDIWQIKAWTDAWIQRFSLMQTDDSEDRSVRDEVAFQHYFKPIVDELKRQPNDSVLSDLVNLTLDDGSTLTYNDIVAHLMGDLFVGGSETTTNAISEGVLLLCEHPDQYQLLMSDLDRYLPVFIEETLRLQAPVHGLFRVATRDTELSGVTIPARSIVHVRYAAANRDSDQFQCPQALDLTREKAAAHVAFGAGKHACIGAPLARREMHWAFSALLRQVKNLRLAPGKNDLTHQPGLMLRALKALHVQFDPA